MEPNASAAAGAQPAHVPSVADPRHSFARTIHPMPRSRICALALAAMSVAGCPNKSAPPSSGVGAPSASSFDTSEAVSADEEVRPVYPADAGPPDPLVLRLCAALHDVPENRRAACCEQKPGVALTSECARTLTFALANKAIAVDAADVDKCAAASQAMYEGCDWVGPFVPEAPDECLGIIKGQLATGKRCRSSLECAGDMRCHGLGPTTMGKCGTASPDNEKCGGSADTLASYTRQGNVDAHHPECKGYCNRTKCAALIGAGGACTFGAACGVGKLCVDRKCATAAPAKFGDACPGGACEKNALCMQGRCVARKPSGVACSTDFECLGGCIKSDGGAKGTCGKRCDLR